MNSFSVSNIEISGISAAVPSNRVRNKDEKFIQATGVEYRRIIDEDKCTSDLCFAAANKLIDDLKIDKNEISVLVFITQTPDYLLPSSSTILQNKLGLNHSCIAIDVSLGCSGYVYGLAVVSSLMKTTNAKYGLLLVGDTISKIVDKNDPATNNLFGDAGSATLLASKENIKTEFKFELGNDGSGSNVIIYPNSACRKSDELNCLKMDGMDVFGFGISKIPNLIKSLLSNTNIAVTSINQWFFHQANLFMLNKINKKVGLNDEDVFYSIRDFGNTSSASIPLTMVLNKKDTHNQNLLLCGFGVGLSWGAVLINQSNKILYSDLIEL